QILGMRDFMETMRSSGEHTGGPKAFSQRDKQNFANALDRLLTQGLRNLK
ncbi:MAG TPA: YaiI/YqxD family protein, partial [Alteromonas macleodii]|nr:YaiI/YqxD family protein [Alteromonas macleodii]